MDPRFSLKIKIKNIPGILADVLCGMFFGFPRIICGRSKYIPRKEMIHWPSSSDFVEFYSALDYRRASELFQDLNPHSVVDLFVFTQGVGALL